MPSTGMPPVGSAEGFQLDRLLMEDAVASTGSLRRAPALCEPCPWLDGIVEASLRQQQGPKCPYDMQRSTRDFNRRKNVKRPSYVLRHMGRAEGELGSTCEDALWAIVVDFRGRGRFLWCGQWARSIPASRQTERTSSKRANHGVVKGSHLGDCPTQPSETCSCSRTGMSCIRCWRTPMQSERTSTAVLRLHGVYGSSR